MTLISLPRDVKCIIDTLRQSGYEAYAVGGCIRDTVLGIAPKDWDITTNARPEEVKSLFRSTVDTGLQHGTVTVIINREGYEVTTYRIDGKYTDGRHPENVIFTASLTEDLKRRDFTINAMAGTEQGIVDEFGGLQDLADGIVRCVGDPEERFAEDALRMLRAVRFAATLGFEIEEKTAAAIRKMHGNLKLISAERINVELVKILLSPNPHRIRTCYELGITSVVLPEFDKCMITNQNNPNHCYSVGEHTIRALEQSENDRLVRLALFFHDFGKPDTKTTDEHGIDHFKGHPALSVRIAKGIMQRLRFDNYTIDGVARLITHHDERYAGGKKSVRRVLSNMDRELFPYLLKVQRADVLAQSDYKREEKLKNLEEIAGYYNEILQSMDCLSVGELAIGGKDLMDMGFPKGPIIGKTLQYLLAEVIENPQLNTREELLKLAKKELENDC